MEALRCAPQKRRCPVEAPRQAFCESLIQTADGLLQFFHAFIVCARGHAPTDRVVTPKCCIRHNDVEVFLSFDLESNVNSVPANVDLSAEDQYAVSAFKDTAERRRTGKSDDQFALIGPE